MTAERSAETYFDEGETVPRRILVERRWSAIAELADVARELPFYRERWKDVAGAPFDTLDETTFPQLPLTKKRDLVDASLERRSALNGTEALLGLEPRNLVMTSGTMGFNTFAVLTDFDLDGASTLAQARELWMMGVRPGMRVLSISPAWHGLGLLESRALTTIGALAVMPWGTLTPRFVGDILDAVTGLAPEHLLVTARALRMLLAECDRIGSDPRRAFRSVRYVGCAGEALSPAFREHVRCRLELDDIFERGGSGDGMFGGGECSFHRGHHISADVHYVEVVDPATGDPVPEGSRGSVVVTNLTLGKSLYIRFATEDVAEIVPGDCPCGRTHPVVEFYARLADSVVLPGRILTPADVRVVLDEFDAVRFRPFAMEWDGARGLSVAVSGDSGAIQEASLPVAAALSDRLDVAVTLTAEEATTAGWKEERLGPRGESP
ncbi:MAG: AMP-binding protein [Acidimicrobiia bacterium]|nr:AMP-binding protein [Acidimicrobiia bacterium]